VSGRRESLVSLLFLLSGATALAFEVVWIKRFSQIWGSSAEALAAVTATLGGVGRCALGMVGRRSFVPSPAHKDATAGTYTLTVTRALCAGAVLPRRHGSGTQARERPPRLIRAAL
jgi:hypothetical protein